MVLEQRKKQRIAGDERMTVGELQMRASWKVLRVILRVSTFPVGEMEPWAGFDQGRGVI